MKAVRRLHNESVWSDIVVRMLQHVDDYQISVSNEGVYVMIYDRVQYAEMVR